MPAPAMTFDSAPVNQDTAAAPMKFDAAPVSQDTAAAPMKFDAAPVEQDTAAATAGPSAGSSQPYTVLDWLGEVTGMNNVVQNLKSLPSEIANMPSTLRQNLRYIPTDEVQRQWEEKGSPVSEEPVSGFATWGSVAPAAGAVSEGAQLLRYSKRAQEAGKVLGELDEILNAAPVNTAKPLEVVNRMKQMEGISQLPRFAQTFLDRVVTRAPAGFASAAQEEPLTFREARDFYKGASHMSAQEFSEMSDEMKFYIGRFANALGDEIQNTANAAQQGTRYTEAMKEFNSAKNMQEVMEILRKWGTRAIGYTLAGKALRIGWGVGQDLWTMTR